MEAPKINKAENNIKSPKITFEEKQTLILEAILKKFPNEALAVSKTYEFASLKHAGQFRAGGQDIPYITHPTEVADLVRQAGGDAVAVCGSFLHDVKEDCGVQDDEIMSLYEQKDFGKDVVGLVDEVSDDKSLSYTENKKNQIAKMAEGYSIRAKLLKLADQICNMRSLVQTPPKWSEDGSKERAYITQMKSTVDAAMGVNPTLEALFEEAHQAAIEFYR